MTTNIGLHNNLKHFDDAMLKQRIQENLLESESLQIKKKYVLTAMTVVLDDYCYLAYSHYHKLSKWLNENLQNKSYYNQFVKLNSYDTQTAISTLDKIRTDVIEYCNTHNKDGAELAQFCIFSRAYIYWVSQRNENIKLYISIIMDDCIKTRMCEIIKEHPDCVYPTIFKEFISQNCEFEISDDILV